MAQCDLGSSEPFNSTLNSVLISKLQKLPICIEDIQLVEIVSGLTVLNKKVFNLRGLKFQMLLCMLL